MSDTDLTATIIENQAAISQDVGEIKGMVSGMKGTVDKLEASLNGNGTPGIKSRVTTIEKSMGEHCAQQTREIESISKNMKELSANVNVIATSMQTHVNDKDKHDLARQITIKTMGIFVLAVATIHTFIPPDFRVWDTIKKFFGL